MHSANISSSSGRPAWLLNGLVPGGYLPLSVMVSKSAFARPSLLEALMLFCILSLAFFMYLVMHCLISSGTLLLWFGLLTVAASATVLTTSTMAFVSVAVLAV